MGQRRHLQLVPFNPNDYSLASVLLRDNATVISRKLDMGAAFSLYFQWPEHRKCLIKVGDQAWESAELSCDEDEKEPTEIIVCKEKPFSKEAESKNVIVRFEIFRTCYEFKAEQGHVDEDDPEFLITQVPTELLLYKFRRLPRFEVSEEQFVEILKGPGDSKNLYRLFAVSPMSVTFCCDELFEADDVYLNLSDCKIPLIIKLGEEGTVTGLLNINDRKEALAYFNFYKNFAYPFLSRKQDVPYEFVEELYQNFVDQHYEKELHKTMLEQFKKTWLEIAEDRAANTVDYVVRGDGGLLGASSLALAFIFQGKELWALHQLCAKKLPKEFLKTESLYTWRTDFLSICPSDLSVVFWYISRSRWVERIYTKFINISNTDAILEPVFVTKSEGDFELDSSSEVVHLPIGKTERILYEDKESFGGMGPANLNLGNLLDNKVLYSAITEKSPVNRDTIYGTKGTYLTYPKSSVESFDSENLRVRAGDRFAIFGKASFSDFRSSVEHSIAVTRKKLG